MNVHGGGKFQYHRTPDGLFLLEEHVPDLGKTYRRVGWIEAERDAQRIVGAMNAKRKESGG